MGDEVNTLENEVSNAWNNVTSTGAPAVLAGIENYASQQLATQAQANTAQAQAAVQKAVNSSGQATGILASIEGSFSNIASGAVFKQYGLYIILGVVGFYFIVKKVL